MSNGIDWQKKLSDDFDVDGYSMTNATAHDIHRKFRKTKADGMREAAEWVTTLLEKYSRRYVIGDLLRIQADKIEHGEPTE